MSTNHETGPKGAHTQEPARHVRPIRAHPYEDDPVDGKKAPDNANGDMLRKTSRRKSEASRFRGAEAWNSPHSLVPSPPESVQAVGQNSHEDCQEYWKYNRCFQAYQPLDGLSLIL
jgi:hypothetical protein